jgi:hypothetical protein
MVSPKSANDDASPANAPCHPAFVNQPLFAATSQVHAHVIRRIERVKPSLRNRRGSPTFAPERLQEKSTEFRVECPNPIRRIGWAHEVDETSVEVGFLEVIDTVAVAPKQVHVGRRQ